MSLLRQVRLRPKIGGHDFEAKTRSARKLLDNGDKVMVSVFFRGREVTHPDIGYRLLQRMAESVKEVASIDGQPLMERNRMNVILSPVVAQETKMKEETKES